MKNRTKLGLGVVVVILVAAVVAVITGLPNRFLATGPDYSNYPRRIRIEMMPEKSPEWRETHYLGPDGQDEETDVYYRNGNVGIQTWRSGKQHTLEHQTITTPDNLVILDAHYAADGKQVVSGVARRDDGSTLSTASTDQDGMVTITTYWYDGKTVFSVQKRKVGASDVDEMYYHKNGKPFVKYVGSIYSRDNPTVLQQWTVDGTLVFDRQTAKDGSYTISVYRPDSTLAYTQKWITYTSYGYGDYGYEGGGSYTSVVLSQTQVFSDDGKRVVEQIDMASGGYMIDKVTEIAADGSKTVYTLSYSNSITHITRYDASGKQTEDTDVKDKRTLDVPKKFTDKPTFDDPNKVWQQQENDPSTRGNDAP
jgi:hypothetical protein